MLVYSKAKKNEKKGEKTNGESKDKRVEGDCARRLMNRKLIVWTEKTLRGKKVEHSIGAGH